MAVSFFNIQEWNVQPWFNTGGTRDKKYLQAPDGDFYYFKTSLSKPRKDYKYEFWSEVIASEIGKFYGFNLLTYDVAYDGIRLGCISKSMFTPEEEELEEGGKFLQAFDNTFDPNNKELRNLYSFQLIESALKFFGFGENLKHIIEILVFDTLIGNSDRHQENWAFITKSSVLGSGFKNFETLIKERKIEQIPAFFRSIIKKTILNKEGTGLSKEAVKMKIYYNKDVRFSPIYDSGSSLGRELIDTKVASMLRNPQELEAYILRGESEIHWNNRKIRFFNMIENLNSTEYQPELNIILKQMEARNDFASIKDIIQNIDNCLPPEFNSSKIPQNRKDLIVKLITLRFQKLMQYKS